VEDYMSPKATKNNCIALEVHILSIWILPFPKEKSRDCALLVDEAERK
jgi:hypothetical protein